MCNSYNQYHTLYFFETQICFYILLLEHMFIITQKSKRCQGMLSAIGEKHAVSEWACAEFMQLSKVYRQHLKNAQPARSADLGDWGFAPTSELRLGSTQTLLATSVFPWKELLLFSSRFRNIMEKKPINGWRKGTTWRGSYCWKMIWVW